MLFEMLTSLMGSGKGRKVRCNGQKPVCWACSRSARHRGSATPPPCEYSQEKKPKATKRGSNRSPEPALLDPGNEDGEQDKQAEEKRGTR